MHPRQTTEIQTHPNDVPNLYGSYFPAFLNNVIIQCSKFILYLRGKLVRCKDHSKNVLDVSLKTTKKANTRSILREQRKGKANKQRSFQRLVSRVN